MKVKIKSGKCAVSREEREEIARFVSCVVNGREKEGVPYHTTPGSDFSWVLDSGNDWWLEFDPMGSYSFKIFHRYSNDEVTEALCKWLAYRLGGEVQ